MAVESAFGIWKGRFRMLQGAMNQETPRGAADFVVATLVVHNLMIFFQDTARIAHFVEQEEHVEVDMYDHDINQRKIGILKRNGLAALICQ